MGGTVGVAVGAGVGALLAAGVGVPVARGVEFAVGAVARGVGLAGRLTAGSGPGAEDCAGAGGSDVPGGPVRGAAGVTGAAGLVDDATARTEGPPGDVEPSDSSSSTGEGSSITELRTIDAEADATRTATSA